MSHAEQEAFVLYQLASILTEMTLEEIIVALFS
jgi:hypothetical protein